MGSASCPVTQTCGYDPHYFAELCMGPMELSNQTSCIADKKMQQAEPKAVKDAYGRESNNYPEDARPHNGRTMEKGRTLHLISQ